MNLIQSNHSYYHFHKDPVDLDFYEHLVITSYLDALEAHDIPKWSHVYEDHAIEELIKMPLTSLEAFDDEDHRLHMNDAETEVFISVYENIYDEIHEDIATTLDKYRLFFDIGDEDNQHYMNICIKTVW